MGVGIAGTKISPFTHDKRSIFHSSPSLRTSHSTLLSHISSYNLQSVSLYIMALLSIVFNRSQLLCAVTKALIAPFRRYTRYDTIPYNTILYVCCYKHINQSISPIRAISAKAKDIMEMRSLRYQSKRVIIISRGFRYQVGEV